MSYTPGPWNSYRLMSGRIVVQDKNWTSVASVADGKDMRGITNARLISAAPELYEVLKLAKEVIDDQAARFHQECRCQLCESLPMAIDAAIAKAEGR